MADPDNREYITSVEAVSADGETIAPLIIFKGSSLLHRYSAVNKLHSYITLGFSDSAYINDDISESWMRHFIKNVARKRVGEWVLLLLDGRESHRTFRFWSLAIKHKIILFKLPPHSTHLLEPLDVGVFQAYKQHHANAVYWAVRTGNIRFDKLDFLGVFQSFRNETFKRATIKHAWRKCGIVPHVPDVILDPMKKRKTIEDEAYAAETARRFTTPPPEEADNCLLRTPQGPQSTHKHIQAFRDDFRINGYCRVNYGHWQLLKLLKAVDKQTYTLSIYTEELDRCIKASAKRKDRERYSQTVGATSGVMTVGDLRVSHSQRLNTKIANIIIKI